MSLFTFYRIIKYNDTIKTLSIAIIITILIENMIREFYYLNS